MTQDYLSHHWGYTRYLLVRNGKRPVWQLSEEKSLLKLIRIQRVQELQFKEFLSSFVISIVTYDE